jgi:hypothetical protein
MTVFWFYSGSLLVLFSRLHDSLLVLFSRLHDSLLVLFSRLHDSFLAFDTGRLHQNKG